MKEPMCGDSKETAVAFSKASTEFLQDIVAERVDYHYEDKGAPKDLSYDVCLRWAKVVLSERSG